MVKFWQLSYALAPVLGLSSEIAFGAEENAASEPLSAGGLVQWFLSMCAVLAIIFVLAYVLKRSRFVQKTSGQMSVVGQLSLGPKESLVKVNIDGREILVGVASGSVSYICDLNQEAAAKSNLEALVTAAAQKAISEKLADLKAEIKEAVAAEIGRNVMQGLASAPNVPPARDAAVRQQQAYAAQAEARENAAIQKMQADTSREEYSFTDLAPIPGVRSYEVVDPHEKVSKQAKPYEFKPLPSEAELKQKKEIPWDELLPSQNFRTVNKDLMRKLEIETAPKPEDYTDEEGNPIPRPVYVQAPFKRHIIGNGFAGRGMIR